MKILILALFFMAPLFGQHSLEEIVDPTLDVSGDWTQLGGWAGGVADGIATCAGAGNLIQKQVRTLNVGSNYRFEYTILSYTGGAIYPSTSTGWFAGSTQTSRSGADTYIEYVPATTSGTNFYFYSSGSTPFNGTIDNISVRLKLTTLYIDKAGSDADSGKVDSQILTLGEAETRGFYSGGAFDIATGTYDETFTVGDDVTITGTSCTVTAIACGANAVTLEGNDFTITTLTGDNITDNRTVTATQRGYNGYSKYLGW